MLDTSPCTLRNPRFHEWLTENDYFNLREIEGVGVCGIGRFIFTVGVLVNIDWVAYEKRFCFSNLNDALAFLNDWDGRTEPVPGVDGCTAIK